jgi:undecaprenyl-diphosphatase
MESTGSEPMSALTYPEMIVIGLFQGVSELFPVSSLGHSVLVPALIGGQWGQDLDMTEAGGAYLDALVAMHVATAVALVAFFWRDWVRIVGGLVTSIRYRRIRTVDEKLAWLLIVATVPVGIAGLALDKVMREYLGKPIPAAIFLAINGAVLFAVEQIQRNRAGDEEFLAALRGHHGQEAEETQVIPVVSSTEITTPMHAVGTAAAVDLRISQLTWKESIAIGACQIFALLPGISRSGSTIVGGLLRGLKHEEAARFAFLLATPVIAAAGLLKIPDLARPEVRSSLGPVAAGTVVAGVGAYFSVKFLVKYFETKTLTPFAIYCVVAGLGCLAFLLVAR